MVRFTLHLLWEEGEQNENDELTFDAAHEKFLMENVREKMLKMKLKDETNATRKFQLTHDIEPSTQISSSYFDHKIQSVELSVSDEIDEKTPW